MIHIFFRISDEDLSDKKQCSGKNLTFFFLNLIILYFHMEMCISLKQFGLTNFERVTAHCDFKCFSVVRVTRCVCFVDRCLSFCLFSFSHFVLPFMDYYYPFGTFSLFLYLFNHIMRKHWTSNNTIKTNS